MRRTLSLVAVVATLAACGGSSGTDAGLDAPLNVPAESCAQPGDEGNDIGVGAFCTPRGNECREFTYARLCLAAVAPDEGQWFCTRTCTSDDQCGIAAVCDGDDRGRACIPIECAPERPDAGAPVDASTDTDAAMDGDSGTIDDAGLDDASSGG